MVESDHTGSIDRESASYKLKKKLLRKAFDAALYGKGECKYSPPEMIARILEITEETRRDMPEDHKQELAYVRQARAASQGEPPSIFKLNLHCIREAAEGLEEVKETILPAAKALKAGARDGIRAEDIVGRVEELLKLSSYPKTTQSAILDAIYQTLTDEMRTVEDVEAVFEPVLSLQPVLRRTVVPRGTMVADMPTGPTIH